MDFSKYPKGLIKSIAEEIDLGMICFLNTGTLEVESVLGESYNTFGDSDFKDFYQEVYDTGRIGLILNNCGWRNLF